MTTLKIGIASYDATKVCTMGMARGEQHVPRREVKGR